MDGSRVECAAPAGHGQLKSPTYRLRPAASEDLKLHVDYLRDQAGADVALRFIENTRSSFVRLADSPGIGAPLRSSSIALAGIRKWRVEGFPRILIFYAIDDRDISIVRVVHAASDWQALLDAD